VVAGEWEVTATGKNAAGLAIYGDTQRVTMRAGLDQILYFTLRPLAGAGSLKVLVTAPAIIESGSELVLESLTGPEIFSQKQGLGSAVIAKELPAGYYALRCVIRYPDGAESGVVESARIARACVTEWTVDLSSLKSQLSAQLSLEAESPLIPEIISSRSRVKNLPINLFAGGIPADAQALWFLNGKALASGRSATLNTEGLPGQCRLDLCAFTATARQGGSCSQTIRLREEKSLGPYLPVEILHPDRVPGQAAPTPVFLGASSADGRAAALLAKESSFSRAVIYREDEGRLDLRPSAAIDMSANGLKKNATSLSLSANGELLAAVNSASTWLCVIESGSGAAHTASLALSRGPSPGSSPAASPGSSPSPNLSATAFSPDGERLYVLAGTARALYAFAVADLLSGQAAAPFWTCDNLEGSSSLSLVSVSVSGEIALASPLGKSIFILKDEGSSFSLVQTLSADSFPAALKKAIAWSPDGARFACLDEGLASLSVFSRPSAQADYTVLCQATLAAHPELQGASSLAYSAAGDGLFTLSAETGLLSLWASDVGSLESAPLTDFGWNLSAESSCLPLGGKLLVSGLTQTNAQGTEQFGALVFYKK
jgi:hypothetical protein